MNWEFKPFILGCLSTVTACCLIWPTGFAAEVAVGPIVQLPPFVVEGKHVRQWYFAEFPELRVLSSCELNVTEGFIRRFLHAKAEFGELVPEEFRANLPEILIMVPPAQAKSIAEEMSQLMHTISNSAQTISHLRVLEEDQSAMYFIVDSEAKSQAPGQVSKSVEDLGPDYLRFTLSSDYTDAELLTRTPAMLPCIVRGLTDTFKAASETERGMYSLPDNWLTSNDWRAVRTDPDAPRPLLPLEELLRGSQPTEKDERYRRLWRAESQLFVRWALFGHSRNGSAGFWKFVRASAGQPVTEDLFRSCFGVDYSDCRDELSDYLYSVTRIPTSWSVEVPVIPRLWFRKAKSDEVDWLTGEWNRVVLKVVEREFPELLPTYQQQALTILAQAVERNERNWRAVASLGLLRAQMGANTEATQLLEQALKAGAQRPMVQIELARLRLASCLQKKSAPNPKLTEPEVADVLSMLAEFLKGPRPMHTAYEIAREVFQHIDRAPNAEESSLLATFDTPPNSPKKQK